MLKVKALVRPILNSLPRAIPDYTDHGTIHSDNLMNLLCNFLGNFDTFPFSQEEKLLLCLCVHLHDIGCILGRADHNKKSVKLLKHRRFSFLEDMVGDDLLACLKYMVLSHSSDYDLESIPREPIHANVRHRLICAVFRLLDGCELSSARTKRVLYEILKTYKKIKPEDAKYWEAHLSTLSVVFNGNTIFVMSKNLRKTRTLIKHLRKDLKEINRVFEEEGFPQLNIEYYKFRLG